jgi:hypothetical protein
VKAIQNHVDDLDPKKVPRGAQLVLVVVINPLLDHIVHLILAIFLWNCHQFESRA